MAGSDQSTPADCRPCQGKLLKNNVLCNIMFEQYHVPGVSAWKVSPLEQQAGLEVLLLSKGRIPR